MPFLRERSGRWSPVRRCLHGFDPPALWIATGRNQISVPGRSPAIPGGDWALRFLFITLAITPTQRILHYPRIILARLR